MAPTLQDAKANVPSLPHVPAIGAGYETQVLRRSAKVILGNHILVDLLVLLSLVIVGAQGQPARVMETVHQLTGAVASFQPQTVPDAAKQGRSVLSLAGVSADHR